VKCRVGAEPDTGTTVGNFLGRVLEAAAVPGEPAQVIGVKPESDTPLPLFVTGIGRNYLSFHDHLL
jgi:hypothetical protein